MRPGKRSGPGGEAGAAGPQGDHATAASDHTAAQRQPHEPTLEDAIAERDRAASNAFLSTHPAWMIAAETALKRRADSGVAFTIEDVYDDVGTPMGGHPNAAGGLIIGAAKRGEIVPVGWTTSTRPARRGGPVRLWVGAG